MIVGRPSLFPVFVTSLYHAHLLAVVVFVPPEETLHQQDERSILPLLEFEVWALMQDSRGQIKRKSVQLEASNLVIIGQLTYIITGKLTNSDFLFLSVKQHQVQAPNK